MSKTAKPYRVAVLVETATSWGRRIVEGIGNYVRQHEPWSIYLEPRSPTDSNFDLGVTDIPRSCKVLWDSRLCRIDGDKIGPLGVNIGIQTTMFSLGSKEAEP